MNRHVTGHAKPVQRYAQGPLCENKTSREVGPSRYLHRLFLDKLQIFECRMLIEKEGRIGQRTLVTIVVDLAGLWGVNSTPLKTFSIKSSNAAMSSEPRSLFLA